MDVKGVRERQRQNLDGEDKKDGRETKVKRGKDRGRREKG